MEPTAGDLLPTTYKPAATCGEKPQEIRHRTTEEVARAPELERQLCRQQQNAKGLETAAKVTEKLSRGRRR